MSTFTKVVNPESVNKGQNISFNYYNSTFREDTRLIWDKEYSIQPSIPSSHRVCPSHALLEIEKAIDFTNLDILDLGCGNGRNSIYMADKGAKVTALDFSRVALNILKNNMSKQNNIIAIKPLFHDICDGLPFSDNSKDLILDSYCLCHFTNLESANEAMNECKRVLKPGGKIIKIHLDINDQYYKERVEKYTKFGHISYDPANKIRKAHFSLDSYIEHVASDYKLIKSLDIEFIDKVRGRDYKRNIFASILEK